MGYGSWRLWWITENIFHEWFNTMPGNCFTKVWYKDFQDSNDWQDIFSISLDDNGEASFIKCLRNRYNKNVNLKESHSFSLSSTIDDKDKSKLTIKILCSCLFVHRSSVKNLQDADDEYVHKASFFYSASKCPF